MPQRREGKGARSNGEAVGGRFTQGELPDQPAHGDLPPLGRPLARDDEQKFRDLLRDSAAAGRLDEYLVERDYDDKFLDWIFYWFLATVQLTDRLVASRAGHP